MRRRKWHERGPLARPPIPCVEEAAACFCGCKPDRWDGAPRFIAVVKLSRDALGLVNETAAL